MAEERGRLRVVWLMAGAAVLAALLALRLGYWQVAEHDRISALAAEQHDATFMLPAHRGDIVDRGGQLLATDVAVYDVVADPQVVAAPDRAKVATALAPILALPAADLEAKLAQPLQFEYLKRRVPKETKDAIEALHLAGIVLTDSTMRSYLVSADGSPTQPEPAAPGRATPTPSPSPLPPPGPRSLASNLLGFVSLDPAKGGQYGLEQYYNRLLRGTDGTTTTIRDGAGNELRLASTKTVPPRKGDTLVLSLDSTIQYFAEKALADGVQKSGAESGSVIVMDSHTGGIVAWADFPTFDANHFGQADERTLLDPIVGGLYEPGSVMKVVTLSGGIESGAITPDYTFNETGAIGVGGYTIRDWDFKAHGVIDMTIVLEKSLNVGAVVAQQRMGGPTFYQNLDRFGIGHLTGVDVAGELAQPLAPYNRLHASELATMSFGQGIAVSPIEMITALNTIANGGVYVRPRVVEATVDADGRRADYPPEPAGTPVSPVTAAKMRDMMIQVVEKGSGWTAKMDGWANRIAGKTGTANIPDKGHYTDNVIASFFGFMPAENPRFTMLVIMRKPKGDALQQEGTFAAAPVWKQIAQEILVRWQMTP